MNVRVMLFAALKDLAGTDQLQLEVAEPATVGRLREELRTRHPRLADMLARSMIAVDDDYAPDDRALAPDAQIACIPPVSGGGGIPTIRG